MGKVWKTLDRSWHSLSKLHGSMDEGDIAETDIKLILGDSRLQVFMEALGVILEASQDVLFDGDEK